MSEAEPKPESPSRDKPRKRSRRRRRVVVVEVRRRRWLRRLILLLVLALLALGAYLIAERVRTSDLPRSIAQSVASRTLGLRVEIAEVDLAWSGETVVRGVTVRLPLDETVMIEIDRINATHRHIGLIGLFRKPGPLQLKLDEVVVIAERDAAGGWNIADAIARVAASLEGRERGKGVPELPELRADTVTVVLRDAGREVGKLRLQLTGDPETAVAYALDIEVADANQSSLGSVRGRIGVGADWSHRFRFSLDSLGPIASFLPEQARQNASGVRASGRWSGQVAGGELRGRLELNGATLGPVHASGGAAVVVGPGPNGVELSMAPRRLRLAAEDIGEAELDGGAIRFADNTVRLERLRARSMGVTADIDGGWRFGRDAGELDVVWNGRRLGPVTAHHGRAELRLLLSEAGRTVLTGMTDTTIELGEHTLQAMVDFDGTASQRPEAEILAAGGLNFRRLTWSRPEEETVDLSGLEARVAMEERTVALTSLTLPGGTLGTAEAEYAIDDGAWRVNVAASDWALPNLDELGETSLAVRASGLGVSAEAWDLSLQSARATVEASGSYNPDRTTPLAANATVALRIEDEPGPAANGSPPLIAGSVLAQLELGGTLTPVALGGEGSLTLSGVRLRGEPLSPVTMRGFAQADAEGVLFTSERFDVLGGEAGLIASILPDASIDVRIGAEGVAFDELSTAIGVGGRLSGVAGFELVAEIPAGDAGRATLTGEWTASGLRVDPIDIDSASGRFEADRREARVGDLVLRRGDGHATGEFSYDLVTQAGLSVDIEATRWPLSYAEFGAVADASVSGTIDLADLTADLTVRADADATFAEEPIGGAVFRGAVHGQTLVIDNSRFIFGSDPNAPSAGRIEASGRVPINAWTETQLHATIEGLDAIRIAGRFLPPEADELVNDSSGLIHGELRIAPSPGPQAFAPLLMTLEGRVAEGAFREVTLDTFDIRLSAGPERIVLEHARLNIADGSVEAWGTSTMHNDERFVRLNATVSELDLDRIAQSSDPTMDPVPGRVSGAVVVGGYLLRPHRLFGESRIVIEQSDLANVGVISTLYNAMNIRPGDREPTGSGFADIRLEGEALEVTRFEYFNRGVDIFATLRLEQVVSLGESPLRGFAGGRIRPLRDLNLPFAATVDRMLASAQSDAVTVRIGGTLGDRSIRVVPFSEAFEGLSDVLGRSDEQER